MSESSPLYVLQPEAPGTEPPGFDSHPAPLSAENLRLIVEATQEEYATDPQQAFWDKSALLRHIDALTAAVGWGRDERHELRTLADIQKESLEMFRLLLAKSDEKRTQAEARVKSQQARAEKAEAEAAHYSDCAQRAYAREIDAITARSKAEARVKSQQDELGSQEVQMLQLVKELGKAKQELGYAAVKAGLLLGNNALAARAKAQAILDGTDPSPANAALTWPCPGCLATSPKECLASTNACVFRPAPAGETDGQPEYGRVDCPSCGNSLAWDEAWALTEGECKYCGYGGTPAK